MVPFFVPIAGSSLAQGDFLTECPIPFFPADFGGGDGPREIPYRRGDLIVVTQSCDLANGKSEVVALCPIFTIPALAAVDSKFGKAKEVDNLRKGRYEGLHLLASPLNPTDNWQSLVVDFRQIHSLPFAFLVAHAATRPTRWRLQSPFLEHFSQAFARFFMRVGLPSSIAEFK